MGTGMGKGRGTGGGPEGMQLRKVSLDNPERRLIAADLLRTLARGMARGEKGWMGGGGEGGGGEEVFSQFI